MQPSTKTSQEELYYSTAFTLQECRAAETKEKIAISQHAEKFQYVARGNHIGAWRNEITPDLAFIMDTIGAEHVREVIFMGTPQGGKSNVLLNALGSFIDQDPAEVLIVFPTRDDVREFMDDRIIPMIENSPQLAQYKSTNPDDTAKYHIKLTNSAIIYTGWANSASRLASKAIKYICLDEVDKYDATVGKETDAIALARKRKRTFGDTYKLIITSSPTREDGHIFLAFNNAQVQYYRHVVCPDCGTEQLMNFDGIKWAEDKTKEEIEAEGLAWYECQHGPCQSEWTETKRNLANRMGKWVRYKGQNIKKPTTVAFHKPGWLSSDVSFAEIAVCAIESKTNRARLIDLYNDYMAMPFKDEQSDRKEAPILALCDARPRGLVPKETAALILIADTQQDSFYYELRAIGYGRNKESWQVREGEAPTFEALRQIAYDDEYTDVDGNVYKVHIAFIDSGGGMGKKPKHSRTAEVYDFCKDYSLFKPVKGHRNPQNPWRMKTIENYPGTNKPIPGGLTLYNLNVTYYKNHLNGKLNIHSEDPGAWHLHKDTSESYARQMCAEYQDEAGWWICPKGKPNHFWDCGVYFLAAVDIIGAEYWPTPDEAAVIEEEETRQSIKPKTKKSRGRKW